LFTYFLAYNRKEPFIPPANVSPQVKQLYLDASNIFRRTDDDGNGTLDPKEFLQTSKQMGYKGDGMFSIHILLAHFISTFY
jgi:hypothetical protein